MQAEMDELEDRYVTIINALDWVAPEEHVEALHELADLGQADAMNLLAVLLGDIDGAAHRDEIIALYERAFDLGAWPSARNLAIQYGQWNEPELSRRWEEKADEAEKAAGSSA